jgi:PAS domain S-box-containing protein
MTENEALRQRAEAAARENAVPAPEDIEALSPEETRRTLHELRVHQLELELQNEELRRTQVELAEARARYFDLYELAPVGYFTLSEAGLILEANLTAATLLGVGRDGLVNRPFSRFIFEADQGRYYRHRQPLFETPMGSAGPGGEAQAFELRLVKKDGTIFWAQLAVTVAPDPAASALVWRVVLSDITGRKQAEAELRESEGRLKKAQAVAHVGSWAWDIRNSQVEWSDEMYRIFGLDRSAITGRLGEAIARVIHPDDLPMVQAANALAFAERKPIEYRLLWPDQSIRTIWVETGEVILDAAGQPNFLTGTCQDITERKRGEEALRESKRRLEKTLAELQETQAQLVQQARLAAVGQLAAGIAHDFNNILTGILGYAELMELSGDTPAALKPMLQQIITSGQRAAQLVSQLLDFSRKSIHQPKQFDLAPVIREVLKFLERTLPENIRLELDLEPGGYLLAADPNQLQNVLTNLAVNARDAMPTGGKLKIGLARFELAGAETCAACGRPVAGEWLGLTVTDTGHGIPAAVLPHIFEPFYTTKAVGQGSGLGLSQVYGIVLQHAGHLTVQSRVGQGTTITLYFPPVSSQNEKPAKKAAPAISKGHGETILLVEDEPSVLKVTKAMLEHLNYQVVTALNGRAALTAYQAHQADIALVLSDLMMPDMAGEELFHRLKAQNPGLKMVLISGYLLEEKGAALLKQGITAWVQKPLSFEQLAQVVSQALSAKPGRWG